MSLLKRIQVILLFIFPLYTLTCLGQYAPQPTSQVIAPGEPGQTNIKIKPLIIGVDSYTPPFSMRGGKDELFGFDISMMNSLCKIMNRTCQFQLMKWVDLLPAITNNQIDFAVSSITITPERTKEINFSLPYALSYSRFLTRSDIPVAEPFTYAALNGKVIAVQSGTIYENQATRLGITNPIIKTYENDPESLKALTNKEVDYILLDNPSALYWAANSAGMFQVLGKPFAYGFGLGIAVNKADIDLIPELNKALLQYQNSTEYKQNYQHFLESF